MTDKKKLKHDPVKEKIFHSIELIKQHHKRIVQLLIGLAVILTGYGVYNNSIQESEFEASAILGTAQNMYIDAQLDLAKLQFQNAADDYDGTTAGSLANFYLATDLLENGNIDEALLILEKLSSKLEDEILESSVMNTIGNIYLNQGDYSSAIKQYLNAADAVQLGPFTHRYQLNAAMGYKLNNQYQDAYSIAKKILDFDNLKYNIKNDTEELIGELEYLMN